MLAEALDEEPEVCERWVDRVWDTLRDRLSPEDRLYAITDLISAGAQRRAEAVLREVDGQ